MNNAIYKIAANTRDSFFKELELYPDDTGFGLCAQASARLYIAFIEEGYEPILHLSELHDSYHVYVSVDNLIVDLTAAQFDSSLAMVEILDIEDTKCRPYWNSDFQYSDLKSLHSKLTSLKWPVESLFEVTL